MNEWMKMAIFQAKLRIWTGDYQELPVRTEIEFGASLTARLSSFPNLTEIVVWNSWKSLEICPAIFQIWKKFGK